MRSRIISAVGLLLALAGLAALAACSEPQAQPAAPPPPAVSVAAAIEREVVHTDEFPGRIEAVESVEVRARVSGYLESVNFKPGAAVRKGELLFVIDPRPFRAEVARAEATLGNTRAQLDLARTQLARQRQLLAERATSRSEYDDAAARVRSLEAEIDAHQASVDIARLNLAYTRIVSPIDGRVGKAEITVGNLIQGEGPGSPVLTTVVSSNPVYAAFEADEAAYLKYISARNGLSVAVGLAGLGARPDEAAPRALLEELHTERPIPVRHAHRAPDFPGHDQLLPALWVDHGHGEPFADQARASLLRTIGLRQIDREWAWGGATGAGVKVAIIALMFVGRIGPLVLSVYLARPANSLRVRHAPDALLGEGQLSGV